MSVNELVVHLEQSEELCKEKGDAVACQVLLLSLLMEVSFTELPSLQSPFGRGLDVPS